LFYASWLTVMMGSALAQIHIGIDDTDSLRGGCTTYICALLVERIMRMGGVFQDYPNLVRLNPNVPWKTRGNGALCLRVLIDAERIPELKEQVIETVEENSVLSDPKTNPGIVLHRGRIHPDLRSFTRMAITRVVRIREAQNLISRFHMDSIVLKGPRGLIGALAAVGGLHEGDYTFELIAYRRPENRGKRRRIVRESVVFMDKKTFPQTFNNIDNETGRILITPRGPDPILYGIRGESPESVLKAHGLVKSLEEVERWVIFRTNQGTDSHLTMVGVISEIQPYQPVIARGWVNSSPRTIPGGHVIFSLRDESGEVDCAAYEPTGRFRDIARNLIPGDYIQVFGGVRPPTGSFKKTVNLEKMLVLKPQPKFMVVNPQCPLCSKRMKSMGRGKGFRCEKCGIRFPSSSKVTVSVPRTVKSGLYIPPPRAHRHLTKPFSRYGYEKNGGPCQPRGAWHYP